MLRKRLITDTLMDLDNWLVLVKDDDHYSKWGESFKSNLIKLNNCDNKERSDQILKLLKRMIIDSGPFDTTFSKIICGL